MYTSVLAIPALLLLSDHVTAQCTNFTSTSRSSDTYSFFTSSNDVAVETLYCNETLSSPCYITPKKYAITAPRKLNISSCPADEESIYQLAAQAYSSDNFTSSEFITRNTSLTNVHVGKTLLTVEPGIGKTLAWLPFQLYSAGRLSGCANSSLEGVYVLAQAPYEVNATKSTENGQLNVDGRVLAGTWSATQRNITAENETAADKKSSGSKVGVWAWSWGIVGFGVAYGVGIL
ncbi:hypothetical protein GLAREA_10046 [Glarea lozoyensis ATCC 20868]|uniref:LysM domain-containing protein n=1 Tax=Glarea lozoyensis (strain ATCC 20868 / MF5171) TaxID=1116229 RepID=S3D789_GLAL2|nr:uncharacterized protein GLAREA_10046 [Glarea lozoyensis ATCC 20868]EPE34352.1 hypothetical protein GLAREA_10046 [Glarea lozoyensis ATCC 20868]